MSNEAMGDVMYGFSHLLWYIVKTMNVVSTCNLAVYRYLQPKESVYVCLRSNAVEVIVMLQIASPIMLYIVKNFSAKDYYLFERLFKKLTKEGL